MDSRPLLYSTRVCSFNNQVEEDDTDRLPTNVVFTPAFTRQVPDDDTEGTWYGIQLVHGNADIASMEQALLRALPPGAAGNFSVTSITEAKVERAVKPESIALAVFGLVALMAALGTALPVMARQLRSSEDERQVIRALGAGPATPSWLWPRCYWRTLPQPYPVVPRRPRRLPSSWDRKELEPSRPADDYLGRAACSLRCHMPGPSDRGDLGGPARVDATEDKRRLRRARCWDYPVPLPRPDEAPVVRYTMDCCLFGPGCP